MYNLRVSGTSAMHERTVGVHSFSVKKRSDLCIPGQLQISQHQCEVWASNLTSSGERSGI